MEKINISADIEQLKKEVWYLKKNMSGGGSGGDVSEELEAIEDRIDAIEESVEELESIAGKEKIDLIYDMRSEDATINRGYTSGATYGNTFRLDFSQYTSIRIYASINGCEVQKVIKVAGRKKSDLSVNAINSTFNSVNYLRFTFPVNNSAFQVGQYAIYSFDLNNNTFQVTKGTTNSLFFVYRLEGIK